jgi:hypothetical protein
MGGLNDPINAFCFFIRFDRPSPMDLKNRVSAGARLGLLGIIILAAVPVSAAEEAAAESDSSAECQRSFGGTFYEYVTSLDALPHAKKVARYRRLRQTVTEISQYVENAGPYLPTDTDWDKWSKLNFDNLIDMLSILRKSDIPETLFDRESLEVPDDKKKIRRNGVSQQIASYEFLFNRILQLSSRVFDEALTIGEQKKIVGAFTNLMALQKNFDSQSSTMKNALERGYTLIGSNWESGGLLIPDGFEPQELIGKPAIIQIRDIPNRPKVSDLYNYEVESLAKFDRLIEYYRTNSPEGIYEVPVELIPDQLKYFVASGKDNTFEAIRGHRESLNRTLQTLLQHAGLFEGKILEIFENTLHFETKDGKKLLINLDSPKHSIRGIAINLMAD